MTFDRVAWRAIAAAYKLLERARKTGVNIPEATERFWQTVDLNPLYP